MKDKEGRQIDYMRVSLTDRCNLRCQYCMPEEGIPLMKHEDILRNEEILQIVKAGADLGIRKIRLTGGEPLLRKGIVQLISDIKCVEGIDEVALTTNGVLLDQMLDELLEAGLDRVNLSLDTLNGNVFETITRFSAFEKVMKGFLRCMDKKVPVKINAVILKGINEDAIKPLIDLTYKWPVDVRFIELMPIGCGKEFQGLSTDDLLHFIQVEGYDFHNIDINKGNGPATYIKMNDALGKVGFISPLSHQFCSDCNRIRVTSEGFLKPCLHSKAGIDLRQVIRKGINQTELSNLLHKGILMKPKSHKFMDVTVEQDLRNMNQIGG